MIDFLNRKGKENKQQIYPSGRKIDMDSLTFLDATDEFTTDNLEAFFSTLTIDDGSSCSITRDGEASETTDREGRGRPAFVIHRDSAIGNGSYGRVYVASRGDVDEISTPNSLARKFNLKKSFIFRKRGRNKLACKCIMPKDSKRLAKILEEAKMLRILQGHEHIIQLHDVFVENNELLIITELGNGGTLFELLTTHPKHGFTEAYAAKTAAELLSAIDFMHSRRICHRDIKLENVVLQSKKDVWSPLKLIDFGLATPFAKGERLTRKVGSPQYVAPEVLKKSYTESCDVWSLGVVTYALLSGSLPFYGEDVMASILRGRIKYPLGLSWDVSDEGVEFVSRLMEYNMSYRCTAQEALKHPWLTANRDPDVLQRVRKGAKCSTSASGPEPQRCRATDASRKQDIFVDRRKPEHE